MPATTSVKKCAPTATLLKATTKANAKKDNLDPGSILEQTSAIINRVTVCPEGNEWKLELNEKKSNPDEESKYV